MFKLSYLQRGWEVVIYLFFYIFYYGKFQTYLSREIHMTNPHMPTAHYHLMAILVLASAPLIH